MYSENDYRNYLMHADHKYLEKIVNGARTRYFYTKEALQGYYNNLKNKGKSAVESVAKTASEIKRNPERFKRQTYSKALSKSRVLRYLDVLGQKKDNAKYRKEVDKRIKAGNAKVRKASKATKKADRRDARRAKILGIVNAIKSAPRKATKAVKDKALSAWNRITGKNNNKTSAQRNMTVNERRKALGLPTSQREIEARHKNIMRKVSKKQTAERTRKTRDSLDPKKNGSSKRRDTLGLPNNPIAINLRKADLETRRRLNRKGGDENLRQIWENMDRRQKNRDSVNPSKNNSNQRRSDLGLLTSQQDIENRHKKLLRNVIQKQAPARTQKNRDSVDPNKNGSNERRRGLGLSYNLTLSNGHNMPVKPTNKVRKTNPKRPPESVIKRRKAVSNAVNKVNQHRRSKSKNRRAINNAVAILNDKSGRFSKR